RRALSLDPRRGGEPYGARHLYRAEPPGAQRRRIDLRQPRRGWRACCHFLEPCQSGSGYAVECRSRKCRRQLGCHEKKRAPGMNTPDRTRPPGPDTIEAAPLRGLPESERTLLIVDDDAPLCQRLARAMERRGFVVSTAESVASGMAAAAQAPAFAVVDLRLGDGSGLDVVGALRTARAAARIVMLTGYGNIATAVAAVKAGALDYLPKPADADAVERALLAQEGETPPPPEDPMSADRVRWEHIQRVFELCERNVSETARRLKMHRRTLQRILSKHAPRN